MYSGARVPRVNLLRRRTRTCIQQVQLSAIEIQVLACWRIRSTTRNARECLCYAISDGIGAKSTSRSVFVFVNIRTHVAEIIALSLGIGISWLSYQYYFISQQHKNNSSHILKNMKI